MSANLRDIEALVDFRAALIVFIEDATTAVQAMLLEIQRSFEWIEHDRPHYWNSQIRRAYDLASEKRVAFDRCRMRKVAGRQPMCIEEKQDLVRAKQRLQDCQEQLKNVKRWAHKVHHASDEFCGRMARLQTMLEVDLPKAVALLEKSISILESYAGIARPGTQPGEGV